MGKTNKNPKLHILSLRVTDGDLQRILGAALDPDQRVGDLLHGLIMEGIRSRLRHEGKRGSA